MNSSFFRYKLLFFKGLLLLLGLYTLAISGCKKPDKGDNGDNIQPMYGVKSVVYNSNK